jgi:hypothetical protein
MRRRAVTCWGVGFLVALLVSAGMASVPTGNDTASVVRSFYVDHGMVVLVAQMIGLVAAGAFVMFSLQLAAAAQADVRRRLQVTGAAVTTGAVLTAVPPLWLVMTAADATATSLHDWARASDLTDVVLFLAVAAFAPAVAVATASWIRPAAAVIGATCVVRAALLATGTDALELLAPLAFMVLVVIAIVGARRDAFAASGSPTS